MRRFLCLALIILSSLPVARGLASDAALDALSALPRKYQDGVMKVVGKNGSPNPYIWTVIARNEYENDAYTCLDILNGQIIKEGHLINLFRLWGISHINVEKVKIGSDGAWLAARDYAASKGRKLASVDYSLRQQGKDTVPFWHIRCFDSEGKLIGSFHLLTTTGTILCTK